MSRKIIKSVLAQEQSEGDGATVRRSIGTHNLRNLDPFLMLDEFHVKKPAGFPDHPHRGFETVTYMLKGSFKHEDFAGHKGTIGPGDLQWMTAGRGIVHAEMPATSEENIGLQLWVNLPKSEKMCEPRYQELLNASVPRVTTPDGNTTIKVIAGKSFGVDAKVITKTPILFLHVVMKKNSVLNQSIPSSYAGFVYVLSGSAKFGPTDSQTIGKPHTTLVLDNSDISDLRIETTEEEADFVIIVGRPIKEPIAQRGPFVMNEPNEIIQAMMDYQTNQNGFERAKHWRSEIGRGIA